MAEVSSLLSLSLPNTNVGFLVDADKEAEAVAVEVRPRQRPFRSAYITWNYRVDHPLVISQFLDAKIRLRNRAEPGKIGGVWARSRHNRRRRREACTLSSPR